MLQQYLQEAKTIVQELVWLPQREEFLKDLERSQQNLQEKFKIVIVGDYNSGKSYFINTLLGEMVSRVSNMPETDRVHIYRYGIQEDITKPDELVWTHHKLNPVLEHFDIVDTPGLNSGDSQATEKGDFHGDMTREFIPSADIVFYVTSIVNSWSASGRELLNYIFNEKCRQIVLILNKIDIFDEPDPLNAKTPEEKIQETVIQIRYRCKEQLSLEPPILAVSCMRAYRAKMIKPPSKESVALLQKSRFNEVMDYIHSSLNDVGRIRLKLQAGTHLSKELLGKTLEQLQEEIQKKSKEKKHFEEELVGVLDVKKLPHEMQTQLKDRLEALLKEERFESTLKKEFFVFWKTLKIGAKTPPADSGLELSINDVLAQLSQSLVEVLEPFQQKIHEKLELNKSWLLPKVRMPLAAFIQRCFVEFTIGYVVPIAFGLFFCIGLIFSTHWLWFLSLLALGGSAYYGYMAPERCFQELKDDLMRYQRNALSPFRENLQEELEPTINHLEMALKEDLKRIRLQLEELEKQQETVTRLFNALEELHQKLDMWMG